MSGINVIVADIANEVDGIAVLAVDIEKDISLRITAFPECRILHPLPVTVKITRGVFLYFLR